MKKICAITGIILFLIPILMAVWSIIDYFALKSNIHGMSDEMAKLKVTALVYKFGSGIYIGLFGTMVLGLTMDGMSYRPKWLFWWMCCLGILWLFYYPVGTAIGFVVLVYFVLNRKKFETIRKKGTEQPPAQGPQKTSGSGSGGFTI